MDDITASIIVQCQTSGASQAVNKLGFSFAMLTRKAVEFGMQSVGEFRSTQDAAWKFGKTFANYMGTAEKAVQDFMDTYNLSEQTARSMLTDTAGVLKGFGFTEKEALKVSEQVSRMGVDLASFTGYAGGAKGAVEAITAAMLGETERLKGLNTVIRMDSEEFKSLTAQMKQSKGVSEQQARALATLELVMRKNKDAIGDYMAEGENFTQTNNIISESFKQLKSNIGQVIYESMGLNDRFGMFAEILADINKWFKQEGPSIILFLGDLNISFMSAMKIIGATIKPLMTDFKNGFYNIIELGKWFAQNIGAIFDALIDKTNSFFGNFENRWQRLDQNMGSWIRSLFKDIDIRMHNALVLRPAGLPEWPLAASRKDENFKKMYTDFFNINNKKLSDYGVTPLPEFLGKGGISSWEGFREKFDMILKQDSQTKAAFAALIEKKFTEKPQDTGKGEKKKTAAAEQSIVNSSMVEMLRSAFRFRETAQSAVMAGTADAARLQSRMFGMGSVDPQKQAANSLKTIDNQMKEVLKKVDAAVAAMTGIKQNTQGFAGIGGTKRIGR